MDSESLLSFRDVVIGYATVFGVKILAALAFWIVGRWLIHFVVRMLQKALGRQQVDPTLLRYIGSIVTVRAPGGSPGAPWDDEVCPGSVRPRHESAGCAA